MGRKKKEGGISTTINICMMAREELINSFHPGILAADQDLMRAALTKISGAVADLKLVLASGKER